MLSQDGSDELTAIGELDELITEELPFDFAEYLAERLGLSAQDAVTLLGDWAQKYEPSPRAVAALRRNVVEVVPESRRAA